MGLFGASDTFECIRKRCDINRRSMVISTVPWHYLSCITIFQFSSLIARLTAVPEVFFKEVSHTPHAVSILTLNGATSW